MQNLSYNSSHWVLIHFFPHSRCGQPSVDSFFKNPEKLQVVLKDLLGRKGSAKKTVNKALPNNVPRGEPVLACIRQQKPRSRFSRLQEEQKGFLRRALICSLSPLPAFLTSSQPPPLLSGHALSGSFQLRLFSTVS